MFRHHGSGSRWAFDLPGETDIRVALPPLWVGPVLAHQPTGDPAPTGATSPATFTQADIDRIVSERLERDRASRPAAPANLAELQAAAAELAQVKAAQGTDLERAVAAAKAEGQAAGRAEVLPNLVAASIAATSGGAINLEQAQRIVAPLNPAYFLDDNGAVSTAKVTEYVGGLPTGGSTSTTPPVAPGQPPATATPTAVPAVGVLPGLGQGSTGGALPSGADLGRAEAARRFGNQAQSAPRAATTIP